MSNLVYLCLPMIYIVCRPEHADAKYGPLPTNLDPLVPKLVEQLLAIGGTHVCLPKKEPGLAQLLREGQVMSAKSLRELPGGPRECSRGHAELWLHHLGSLQMGAGYGLTERDGMWQQYSWFQHQEGYVVETAVACSCYFGAPTAQFDPLWGAMEMARLAWQPFDDTDGIDTTLPAKLPSRSDGRVRRPDMV
jgi:hypothetical protein